MVSGERKEHVLQSRCGHFRALSKIIEFYVLLLIPSVILQLGSIAGAMHRNGTLPAP